ncbi:MAG: integrase arm-type DNA-binding domain-containing protein [Alphaproteobacteria bacterium]|nr:integrase arm-type DNA-binding domain-containing protein [Alphaproteobacteria bacterium]
MAHQFFFNSYILDSLPSPETGFDVVQDLSEPRLRMYITQRGVKSFFVRKRINGRDKRIIIGKYPETDIEDARAKVADVLDNATKKIPTRRKKISFRDFVDLYLNHKVRRSEDSLNKLKRSINTHFRDLFDKNIQDITESDLQKSLDNIAGRAMALRMQELLQSIFNYAVDMGYRKDNPSEHIVKIKVMRRERKLNKSGLQKLLTAIKKEQNINLRSAFLMLIYGFAPKTKVFKMRWEDLDFNHDMWGDMPLSDRAVLLLQDLPQDGEWVFIGRGRFHLTDPRTAWKRVVHNAHMPDVTMDDVHKFLMRALVWNPDKDNLRNNMNDLLDDLFA